MKNNNPVLISLDIETTDLSPTRGSIIEIGAYKFNHKKYLGKFSTLLKSGHTIPDLITCLTGISNKDLEGAPKLKDKKAEYVTNKSMLEQKKLQSKIAVSVSQDGLIESRVSPYKIVTDNSHFEKKD